MTFRTFTKEQLALLLHGLRAIHVADSETDRAKMETAIETELAARGLKLAA